MHRAGDLLHLDWWYDTARLERYTVEELAEQFPLALIEITSDAAAPPPWPDLDGSARIAATARSGHHRGAFGRTARHIAALSRPERVGPSPPEMSGARTEVRKRGGTAALAHRRDVVPVPEMSPSGPTGHEADARERLPRKPGEWVARTSRRSNSRSSTTGTATTPSAPASRAATARPEYVFYDGPPFANGLPHYGHLLTGYVKDIVPRYRTMRGYKVERRFGWDTHGLPAELEVAAPARHHRQGADRGDGHREVQRRLPGLGAQVHRRVARAT